MKNKKLNEKKTMLFLFTCVKDGRQYITKLFSSLLNQTCTEFVHFIYDNGSVDSVDDLVAKYIEDVAKLSKPYKVIFEKTKEAVGLNMATKYCIEKCTEPYFIWVDCDNWLDKHFIKHLISKIKRQPNSILYRTFLFKCDENGCISSNYRKRIMSTRNKNDAAFTFFTRKNRYYYSFFAVNLKQYLQISKNNILDIRNYYNDEQVLTYCYLSDGDISFVKNAKGYYLARDNSEAHLIRHNFDNNVMYFCDLRQEIARSISQKAEDRYLQIKKLFEEYNLMFYSYERKNFVESRSHFSNIYKISKKKKYSLNATFRNKDFLYWLFVLHIKKGLGFKK